METSDRIKKHAIRTKIKFHTYAKTRKWFIYVDCQTNSVSLMVTKETWIKAKVAKICNKIGV